MGSVAGQVGVEVASAIVTEAVEDVLGNSRRKWAVVLLAIVLGVVVAGIVKKRRGSQNADDVMQKQAQIDADDLSAELDEAKKDANSDSTSS